MLPILTGEGVIKGIVFWEFPGLGVSPRGKNPKLFVKRERKFFISFALSSIVKKSPCCPVLLESQSYVY